MPVNSENIITNQVHPGDSTTETITGDAFKGDGYYGRSDGFHTVQVNLEGFIGRFEMQGTLAIDPSANDWFTIELGTGRQSVDTTGALTEENITYVEYAENETSTRSYNFTGNYVWVRAYVSNWTDGTVSSVRLNH